MLLLSVNLSFNIIHSSFKTRYISIKDWFFYYLQNIAANNLSLPITHKCAIHAVVGSYMCLLSQVCELPQLLRYSLEVSQSFLIADTL